MLLEPLEADWLFASPLAPRDGEGLVEEFFDSCRAEEKAWDTLLLSGLVLGSPLFRDFVTRFASIYRVGILNETYRHVASLAGGEEGFLSRRSPRFRSGIRRAQRRARESGIRFEVERQFPTPAARTALYERIQAVERRSWKGIEGHGITEPRMRGFYALMIERLGARDALRVVFAYRDEPEPIAYVFGGIRGSVFRGLQLAHDHRFAALSPGNLGQIEMIRHLESNGVRSYDMGCQMDYKRRWAESGRSTVTLLVDRSQESISAKG
jgi:hypothetical protein